MRYEPISSSKSKGGSDFLKQAALVASIVAITAAACTGISLSKAGRLQFANEGQVLTSTGTEASIMNQFIRFPVLSQSQQDFASLSEMRNDLGDSLKGVDGSFKALVFGNTFDYYPLGTADEDDIKHFFKHIASSGDGRAACRSMIENEIWNYNVNLAETTHDTESDVYVGTGYSPKSLPFVTLPVLIADCNKAHPGVCVVGEAESTVLPWTLDTSERNLETSSSESIKDYTIKPGTQARLLMKANSEYRRKLTASFWSFKEVAACWTDSYDLLGFNSKGHSFLAAVPSDESSDCPMIAVHAAPDTTDLYHGEDGEERFDNLDKFAMVLTELPEDMIDFKVSMPLRKFYAAVDFARTAYDGSSYDLFQNNCHVFIFDVLAYLNVPYKSEGLKNDMADYATGMIMKDDKMKTALLNAVSNHSVQGNLMRRLRNEKFNVRFAVAKVIESHTVDLTNAF